MSEKYFLKLDQFEGPLDLLLHLIKASELDIFDIDLYTVTAQYLDFLRLIKFKDIKEASAFIEMAACLLEIKSRQLIPGSEKGTPTNDDHDPEMTAEVLQKRLFLYDMFKKAAQQFSDQDKLNHLSFSNYEHKRLEELYSEHDRPIKGEPVTLVVLYEQMLKNLSEKRPIRVKAETESISIDKIIDKLQEYLKKIECIQFDKLYDKFSSRYELVVNILAVLQLTRDRQMKIYQNELHGPMWIYRSELNDDYLKKNSTLVT